MRLTRVLCWYKDYKRVLHYNNEYQKKRMRFVKHLGVRENLEARGFQVQETQDILDSYTHLPATPEYHEDWNERDPLKKPVPDESSHPLYHERPAWTYQFRSSYLRDIQLDCAKSLLNTVEISTGLPNSIMSMATPDDSFSGQHELVEDSIKEALLNDSTQRKLPRRRKVPFRGYHPVVSKLNEGAKRLPYEVKFLYNFSEKRDYGIPYPRRCESLVRGFFHNCDLMAADHPDLLDFTVMEKCVLRQFFESRGGLIRFYLDVPFVAFSPTPLKPFADAAQVEATRDARAPDISPLLPYAHLDECHVYLHQNNFPVLDATRHSAPNAVMAVSTYAVRQPMWSEDHYAARALTICFQLALGQARLLYGEDVVGRDLPEPVASQCVTTDGQQFHFAAFQLNTLKLDDEAGVKNIFWHEEQLSSLYEVCDHVNARPTLDGYNPDVISKFAAMYRQGLPGKRKQTDPRSSAIVEP